MVDMILLMTNWHVFEKLQCKLFHIYAYCHVQCGLAKLKCLGKEGVLYIYTFSYYYFIQHVLIISSSSSLSLSSSDALP